MNYELRIKNLIISIIQWQAKVILKKYKPRIVAITGSVGKTSTKEAIFVVLSGFFKVRKSEKSFNSEIGVPLTILGCPNAWNSPILWIKNILWGFFTIIFRVDYPEWLILEVGADKPGDIKEISSWLKSDVVVLTKIAEIPAHIEFFKDKKEVVKEKLQLVNSLKSEGIIVLNHDDDDSFINIKADSGHRVVGFGFNETADLLASNYKIHYRESGGIKIPDGMSFKVDHKGSNFPVRLNGVFGKQYVYVCLSALSVGVALQLNFVKMLDVIGGLKGTPGRFNILEGVNNSVLIDDTYNSSPAALEMGIDNISEMEGFGKKIAVLGDMLELGKRSDEAHFEIGKRIPSVFKYLFVVGKHAKLFAEGAVSMGMKKENVFYFDDSASAASKVKDIIKKGDIVFVKGSQGMRMEKISAVLIDKDAFKISSLVRQEKEWLIK